MIQISQIFNDQFEPDEEALSFIQQNPSEALKQINDYFESINIVFTEEDAYWINKLYIHSDVEQVFIHVLNRAYQFFIDKVPIMLDRKMYSGIKTLLDIFWHNWMDIDWSNIDRNIKFLHNTYPILFCEDDFAEIAARFYWDLITSSNNEYNGEDILLKKEFIAKHYDRYDWLFPFEKPN